MRIVGHLPVLTALLTVLTTSSWAQAGKVATFSDDFKDGRLDTSKWIASDGNSPRVGNDPAGRFSPSNLDFTQGMLCIRLTQVRTEDGIRSSGGEIRSREKFGYGFYEFTMRVGSASETPNGSGSIVSGGVSGAFSFINNSQTEIDIEATGNEPGNIYLTTWINSNPSDAPTIKESDEFPIRSKQFHTYGYKWHPGRVEWYLDGQLITVHTKNVPAAPAYILLNHWGTDNDHWGGTATPGVTRYMYVKSVSYTAMGKR